MQQVDRCELLTLLNVIDSRFFLLNDVFPWFNVFSFIPFVHFIFLDNFDIHNEITLIKLSINKLTKGFETSSSTLGQSLNISQMKSFTNRSFGWLFKLYLNRSWKIGHDRAINGDEYYVHYVVCNKYTRNNTLNQIIKHV